MTEIIGDRIEVENPATGEKVGSVERTTPEAVAAAVDRARAAQEGWSRRGFGQRAAVIKRFHDRVIASAAEIMDMLQAETGKARRDAFPEVSSVAGIARHYIAHGKEHLASSRQRSALPGVTSARVEFKPRGVVGVISPWNFPFLLPIGDALPALLAGNAVVLKPSELTPLSAELGRRLLIESGLDPDLFQLVHGEGPTTGQELVHHVDYIAFTGSLRGGRAVAAAAGERLIPYSLELGGKNPMLVLPGAAVGQAVEGLMMGAFYNAGQTCIAVERVYVHESIYESFVRRAAERSHDLRVGFATDWSIDVGSLISRDHASKVLAHVEDAALRGAEIVAGGGRREDLGPSFIQPTILTGVPEVAMMAREETFGPVVAVYPVRDTEEAVARANDSAYGLNASVWAGSRRQAHAVSRRLATGSAGINSTLLIFNSFDVPMGGVRGSGIGRRFGQEGIRRFTAPQSVVRSIATGGGYDTLIGRLGNLRGSRFYLRLLRWWRHIPGLR
ncbi:MAG TPA: succinic semialdehyde dehydrogenase [Thermoanaerobaculia bacterium]|nr:succinic semialdehyde dehydrogenase [Thermoanaerobaculia bacterium]